MDEEMRFHLDKLAEHFERAGASPAEARRLAAVEFGGVERQRDAARDVLRPARSKILRGIFASARGCSHALP